VRGKIPLRGEEIKRALTSGSQQFPFPNTTALNIGNPQAVGQGFVSFNREVLSGLINPKLVENGGLSKDAAERVKLYQS